MLSKSTHDLPASRTEVRMSPKIRKGLLLSIPITPLIFLALAVLSANDEDHWLQNMLASPDRLQSWIFIAFWGSIALYLAGWGIAALFARSFRRRGVTPAERVLLLMLFFACTAFSTYTLPGTYSYEIVWGLFVSFIEALAFHWFTLKCKRSLIATLRDAEHGSLGDWEYYCLFAAACTLAAILFLAKVDEISGSAFFTFILAYMLSIPLWMLLTWLYAATKAAIRRRLYGGNPIVYETEAFVFHGLMRSVLLPRSSITAIEKINVASANPGESALLSVSSSARERPIAIPWPGDEVVRALREKLGADVPYAEWTAEPKADHPAGPRANPFEEGKKASQ
jgi:hypothetical protein